MFPPDHPRALAKGIPNAELLLLLPSAGHLMFSDSWDRVVRAILKHTAQG